MNWRTDMHTDLTDIITKFMKILYSLFFVFSAFSTFAGDDGFRYRKSGDDYGCFNDSGKEGLNLDNFEECGDHRHSSHSGIQLANKYLAFSNFDGADFSYADLSGADLFGSSTSQTDFTGAIITSITSLPFSRTTAYDIYKMEYRGIESERYCFVYEYGIYCEGKTSGDFPYQ